MTVGYVGFGAGYQDGVLVEPRSLARIPATYTIPSAGTLRLASYVTAGPASAATGALTAWAMFAATTGGLPLYGQTFASRTPGTGDRVSLVPGDYAVTAGASPADAVLTVGAEPLTIDAAPLEASDG